MQGSKAEDDPIDWPEKMAELRKFGRGKFHNPQDVEDFVGFSLLYLLRYPTTRNKILWCEFLREEFGRKGSKKNEALMSAGEHDSFDASKHNHNVLELQTSPSPQWAAAKRREISKKQYICDFCAQPFIRPIKEHEKKKMQSVDGRVPCGSCGRKIGKQRTKERWSAA